MKKIFLFSGKAGDLKEAIKKAAADQSKTA